MPNFGTEVTDGALAPAGAPAAYGGDTSANSHHTDNLRNEEGEFSAQGRADISVILNQLMTITDQVNFIHF